MSSKTFSKTRVKTAPKALPKTPVTVGNPVLSGVKVAIVCDWLETYAGAERVLEQMITLFPQAQIFCVVDWVPPAERAFLQERPTTASFIQHLPFAKKKFRAYLPLMPLAVECLDVRAFDLIISSSHAVAKGVLTSPNQLHVCYCHTPMRYAWDLQPQYLEHLGRWKRPFAAMLLHWMRLWDASAALRVDHYVANSAYIARRIAKVYRRSAEVIYPPVDVPMTLTTAAKAKHVPAAIPNAQQPCNSQAQEYVALSRFVPYKNMSLIAQAFASMPQRRLCMIGDGPDLKKTQKLATPNVRFLGRASRAQVQAQLAQSRAMIFAAEEDFGIAAVEAQAAGLPVIAYGKGGACETVRGLDSKHPTGLFFFTQSQQAICAALELFEQNERRFSPKACHQNALGFSTIRFQQEFLGFVEKAWRAHLHPSPRV